MSSALQAHIPLFLYPFLNTISKTRPFEYLRLTSLGVVGALVKMDDSVRHLIMMYNFVMLYKGMILYIMI
jgi:hypothetical protein